MKEIGLKELKMVKVNKLMNMESNIGDHGNKISEMVLAVWNYLMEMNTKEILKKVLKQDLEKSTLKMGIDMKEIISITNFMEMENISGKMDQLMMENSIQVFGKDMENGDQAKILKNVINMKVPTRMIKRMGMENISGQIDHSTKDTSKTI